jgi:hypothetical protein
MAVLYAAISFFGFGMNVAIEKNGILFEQQLKI